MNTTSNTARIAAFFAATLVTTVLVGSQFGLAGRYDAEAAAVLAGQAVSGQVAQTTTRGQAG